MRTIRLLALIVLLGLPALVGALYVREWLAVDAALDAGASYNYSAGIADPHHTHPYIPFAARHRLLLVASVLSLAAVLGYLVIPRRITRRTHVDLPRS